MFSESMEFGFSSIEDSAGEEVSYIINNVAHSLIAVPARELGSEPQAGGRTAVTNRSVDFLIRKDLLPTQPVRGHEIVRANGSRYRTMPVNGGPVWRWSDGTETYYRIQTVYVSG